MNQDSCNRVNRLSDAQYLWELAKYRSKKLGREFTISIEDVEAVDSDRCPYLHTPMYRTPQQVGERRKKDQAAKTLDRIDSAKGYVPGNVIICSWKANRLLSDATLPEISLLAHNFRRILSSTQQTK